MSNETKIYSYEDIIHEAEDDIKSNNFAPDSPTFMIWLSGLIKPGQLIEVDHTNYSYEIIADGLYDKQSVVIKIGIGNSYVYYNKDHDHWVSHPSNATVYHCPDQMTILVKDVNHVKDEYKNDDMFHVSIMPFTIAIRKEAKL